MGRSQEVRSALSIAVQAGISVLLWGEPGVGKTSAIVGLAESLGWNCEILIGSIRDATDFGGLPVRTERGVELAAPSWATRISEEHARGRRSLLFLDELTTAQPAVQAAMLRIVLDRVAGDHVLPPDTAIVAAANPPETAADGYDLAPPLANRFCHLEWPVDASDWVTGMIAGWGNATFARVPDDWSDGLPSWHASVAGFINHRPDLLHFIPRDLTAQSRAWPSPRSWTMATRLCAATAATAPQSSTMFELLAGSVGEGAATEFLTWLDAADLPEPEAVLADPTVLDLPMRGDRLFAVLGGVTGRVAADNTEERWNQGWAVLDTVVRSGQADVAAVAARSLIALRHASWLLPETIDAFGPVLTSAGVLSHA